MTDLKQAAQMALEALRYPLDTSAKLFDADKAELMNLRAINALRKALEEQPEKYTFGTPLLDLFKVSPGQIVHADVLAEPDSDYERGFVDGMNMQTKRSVDKAVNRMAEQEPSGSFVLWENTLCNPLSDPRSMAHSAWHDGYASGVKAEREACAKVCEDEGQRIDASWSSCAAAIRSRT